MKRNGSHKSRLVVRECYDNGSIYQDKKKVHFQNVGNASVNAVARSELCCIAFEIKGLPGVALVDSGSQVSIISKQFTVWISYQMQKLFSHPCTLEVLALKDFVQKLLLYL